MSIFEQAARQKLRFKAVNGLVATEDLWDLPLAQLDDIAKGLRKDLRDADDSFIDEKKANTALELRFEIVKHVITAKLADRDAAAIKRENAARRRQLLEVLADKQGESLRSRSIEDIQKELDSLSG